MSHDISNAVGLWVTVEIEKTRVPEFLEIMKEDAIDTVTKENGGCYKFDVLKDKESDNKFHFYEIYRDADAFAYHQTTPHFQKWIDFKATGAVLSVEVKQLGVSIFEALNR